MSEKSSFVPELLRKDQYPLWKKKVEAYKILSTVQKDKQALNLAIKIRNDTISQALFTKLSISEMNSEDGVNKLIRVLDGICLANSVEGVFTAIDNLESFKRKTGTTMIEYLEEFERRRSIINEFMPTDEHGKKMDCSDSILAFRIMKQAQLPESEENMVRAYVKELNTTEMIDVLKRIYGERIVDESSSKITHQPPIKEEIYQHNHTDEDDEEQCLYNNYYRNNKFKKKGGPSNYRQNGQSSNQQEKFKKRCFYCRSEEHLIAECPQRKNNDNQKKRIFLTSNIFEEQMITEEGVEDIFIVSETMNKALLDTGASATVCGKSWLKCYKDSFTSQEKSDIEECSTNRKFRFGDGRLVAAEKQLQIPVRICDKYFLLNTHVVDCDIPLLLSRDAMKQMNCKIDTGTDKLIIDDISQDLYISESGHMLASIERCEENINESY